MSKRRRAWEDLAEAGIPVRWSVTYIIYGEDSRPVTRWVTIDAPTRNAALATLAHWRTHYVTAYAEPVSEVIGRLARLMNGPPILPTPESLAAAPAVALDDLTGGER